MTMQPVIWQYWETRGEKPAFVDGVHRLARRNSGCEVNLVTPETLHNYLPNIPGHVLKIKELAHKADMIRAMLLSRHGGMWLDSDAIVLRELKWLFDFLEKYDFVAFNYKGPADPPGFSVNCLLSRAKGRIATEWATQQHSKFPRVKYRWTEIGQDLLDPICLTNLDQVKVLPFAEICPIMWDHVEEFQQSPARADQILEKCYVVMLSNASLKDRAPELRRLTCQDIAHGDYLLSAIMRRALGGQPVDDVTRPAPERNVFLSRLISRQRSRQSVAFYLRKLVRSPRARAINRIGPILRHLRRYRFNNSRFWDRRYRRDLHLGSGPGSRGENLVLKSRIISAGIAEHGISSVLDIGCGDIAILDSLAIAGYVGIDISSVIIERNRLRRPDWTFICADLRGSFNPPAADMVLCLDVLIHQRAKQHYLAILTKAIQSAKKLTLVSGYSKPDPTGNHTVFYHEPIEMSVRRICPQASIEKLAEYRATDLLKITM